MTLERYVRNEEEVAVVHYDGSGEMMQELQTSFPKVFEVRKGYSGKPLLIVYDGRSYTSVSPGNYIVFDSCNTVQVYPPDYFHIMFRRADECVNVEELARKMFELDIEESSVREYRELQEVEKLVYKEQARMLLTDFVIVRRDSDELF